MAISGRFIPKSNLSPEDLGVTVHIPVSAGKACADNSQRHVQQPKCIGSKAFFSRKMIATGHLEGTGVSLKTLTPVKTGAI